MEVWAVVGIALVVILSAWGGHVLLRHLQRNANWSTDFGRRHGKGAQLLLGALVGAIALLAAVALPDTDGGARNLFAGLAGIAIVATFGWLYLGWRRG
jgi:LPXTG-motif cell wall-anchored protein